jgi:hypothetical protein
MRKRYTFKDRYLRKAANAMGLDWRKVKRWGLGKRSFSHSSAAIALRASLTSRPIKINPLFIDPVLLRESLSDWAKDQIGKTYGQVVDEQNDIARSQMLAAYRRIKEGKET